MSRQILRLVLTLATLVAASGTSGLLFECNLDGVVRSSCCCAGDHERPSTTVLESTGCCEIRTVPTHERPAEAMRDTTAPLAFPNPITLRTPIVPPHRAIAPVPVQPQAHGPPIYTAICSYLI